MTNFTKKEYEIYNRIEKHNLEIRGKIGAWGMIVLMIPYVLILRFGIDWENTDIELFIPLVLGCGLLYISVNSLSTKK